MRQGWLQVAVGIANKLDFTTEKITGGEEEHVDKMPGIKLA